MPVFVDKHKPRQAVSVDLTLRHYANYGGGKKLNKQLEKAQQEYKENSKKARKKIFNYNHDGIAEHGLSWNHMNRKQREKWFKEMLRSDQRVPSEALAWAKERGLI